MLFRSDIMITLSFCGTTKWEISHIVQVFRQFSAKLSDVRHLFIAYCRQGPEIDQHEWSQLLRPFTTVQTLHVERLAFDPPTLEDVNEEMVTEAEILPALGLIYLQCRFPQVAFSTFKFFENLVAIRSLSKCPGTAAAHKTEFDDRLISYVRNRDYQIHSPYGQAYGYTYDM